MTPVSLWHALFLSRDKSVFSVIEDTDDGLLFFFVAMEEVASNIKDILTSDPVEESVSEVSFTDKFNILNDQIIL